jgi:hypothetical protein
MRRAFAGMLVAVLMGALSAAGRVSEGAAPPAPWADRGWINGPDTQGGPTVENPKHGLRLLWPIGWNIEPEERYQSQPTVLISMKKFGDMAGGDVRAGVVIVTVPVGKSTPEEFYNHELAYYHQQPAAQVLGGGPAGAPGMYETQLVLRQNNLHVRNVYFIRSGMGYTVSLVQAADAKPAEIAELERVRQYMGLPAARPIGAQPPRPAPGVRISAIVFARSMSSELKPIDAGVKFPPGTSEIHAIFNADGLKSDDVIGDALYAGTNKVLDEKKTATQVLNHAPAEHETIAYNFSHSGGGFPPGAYKLELSVNGKVLQSGAFEVLAK